MDPISIAVGCGSLISLIAKTSTTINSFVREVRGARADLDAVSRELHSLSNVLDLLADDGAVQLPEQLTAQVSSILQNCQGVVAEIEVALKAHAGGGNVKQRVGWAWTGHGDMEKLRSSLEAHKSALNIAVDMASL